VLDVVDGDRDRNLTLDSKELDAIAAALERTGAGSGPVRPSA